MRSNALKMLCQIRNLTIKHYENVCNHDYTVLQEHCNALKRF